MCGVTETESHSEVQGARNDVATVACFQVTEDIEG